MESDEEVVVKEGWWPEAIPTAVPPPIFLQLWPGDSLFRCFRSPPPCSESMSRDLYIGVFRSRPVGRAVDGWPRTLEETKR
jgi:hypothetical protein